MVDPGGLIVLGTSAPLALKMLGPTADYVGNELQQWTERRVQNLGRIFENAERKLGEETLDEPGGIPPRVLKEVMVEGSYCDDELGAEYFGGILASSRTTTLRDDRGAALGSLVGRLSVYQLRTHYLMYEHARRLISGAGERIGINRVREDHGQIYMPYSAWTEGMAFEGEEAARGGEILQHAIVGLAREDLLDEGYALGNTDALERTFERAFPEPGIVYTVTLHGIEVFTKAHGVPSKFIVSAYLSPSSNFSVAIPVELPAGATKLRDLPELD